MTSPTAIPAAPARRSMLAPLGRACFRMRDVLLPAVLVALAIGSMPAQPLGGARFDAIMLFAGLAVALGGQLLRALVIGLVYIQRGGKKRRIHAETLVQDGFFAHCRNPLYVGNIMIQLGLLGVLNSPLGYAIGVPFILLVYRSIVAAEEEFLRGKFAAEYQRYCARVPRFRLRLAGLGSTLRSTAFDWRRLIRKEYGATAAWMSLATAMLLWKWHRTADANAVLPPRVVLIAWCLVAIFWASARVLKKCGKLG